MAAHIRVKWGKQTMDALEVHLEQPVIDLKVQLFSLTNVLPEKQKLLIKGRVMQDTATLAASGVTDGALLMLMGTAEPFVEPTESMRFQEDITSEEMALMHRQKEGVALPSGLENLGNTCYLNSSVQCLRRIPELKAALTSYQVTNTNDIAARFTREFGNVIEKLETTAGAVTPLAFVMAVRSTFPQFNQMDESHNYRQQDADECWNSLLGVVGTKLRCLTAEGTEASVVDALFNIPVHTRYSNTEAPEEPSEERLESCNKLACIIDNQASPVDFLIDGLRAGLEDSVEKMSEMLGRNAVYRKEQRIAALPPYLTIQFVRFIWKQASSAAGTQATKAKVLRRVTFPKVLDIYEFCAPETQRSLDVGRDMQRQMREEGKDEDPMSLDAELGTGIETGQYQLVGVVTHKGRSADSGHYVGWVHYKDDLWVCYDDERVEFVSIDDILRLSGGGDWHMAYICLYRKLQLIPK
jgi:ubiquitin carboxyl-terminal hydrolase 14